MSAQPPSGQALLLVIDPVARTVDGESVRVARDVLRAGAHVKVALVENEEDVRHALAHRGRRRPVVIGDDRALHRVVQVLHQRGELASCVAHVPVGPPETIALGLALGLPTHPAPAARAVLSGLERRLDLLVDDRGGVVLGGVEISSAGYGTRTHPRRRVPPDAAQPPDGASGDGLGAGGAWWGSVGRSVRSLARSVRMPLPGLLPNQLSRLRVEADGVVLVDLDKPVRLVTVSNGCPTAALTDHAHDGEATPPGHPDDGLVEVLVRPPAQGPPVRVCARAVTVSGGNFSYAADAELTGPVHTRTWTVKPGAWRLTVPGQSP